MSFDEFLNIDTPENVVFGYEVVGIGSRFMAAIVDTLLILAAQLIALIGLLGLYAFLNVDLENASWAIAILILINFLFFWGYYVFFEMLWHGQSPGKRLVGLRVIRRDGTPVTLAEVIVRNLVRIIDFAPAMYGIGIVTMFIDKQSRRFGDLAAGTLVVREQESVTLANLDRERLPVTPLIKIYNQHLLAEIDSWPIALLSEADIDLLERYLRRRHELANSDVLARKLLQRILRKMALTEREISHADAPGVAAHVVRSYRQGKEGMTKSPETTYNSVDEVL